jgi:MoxR-like ATPase
MARKPTKKEISTQVTEAPSTAPAPAAVAEDGPALDLQRPPAELQFAEELARLATDDANKPRPRNWKLTPLSVVRFVLGDEQFGIAPKFVGKRSFVERAVVALATNRGLMLIGEPGTAKSWLSELLAAAVSGDSTLTIQGSAGTTEDAIKYSWNYALLLAEGPNERSLVPAPLYRGMQEGKIVRFEELTRCPLEMQDVLLSILSDRVMAVPELRGDARTLFAQAGFNVIATANTRDRGVNEMSAALKRRFNFETVHPIADLREEMALVQRETDKLLRRAGIPKSLPAEMTEVLVTTFHELRSGQASDGNALEQLTTAMSTAEAISTGYAAGLHAWYYEGAEVQAGHIVQHLIGTALKDSADDLKKLRHYFNHVVKGRSGRGWQALYEAREQLP